MKSLNKRWIKAAVLTVGVADCVGLYYAQQRLNAPVPDKIRFDRTAIMVPDGHDRFRVGATVLLAEAAASSSVAVAASGEVAELSETVASSHQVRIEPVPAVVTAVSQPRTSGGTSLARLVPELQERSEFSRVFAGFEVGIDQERQLELALPVIEPARGAASQADLAAGGPMLETPLPLQAEEPAPVTAQADAGEAKL